MGVREWGWGSQSGGRGVRRRNRGGDGAVVGYGRTLLVREGVGSGTGVLRSMTSLFFLIAELRTQGIAGCVSFIGSARRGRLAFLS